MRTLVVYLARSCRSRCIWWKYGEDIRSICVFVIVKTIQAEYQFSAEIADLQNPIFSSPKFTERVYA